MASLVLPMVEKSVAGPGLWGVTLGLVVLLLVADFLVTRKPHEVSFKEASWWSAFYIALPLAFGVFIWQKFGGEHGVEYYTGYIVEKTLSVDNLFVFMLLLTSFAVPVVLQQRVLLYGIVGALVLRGIFIYLGAAALSTFDWAFLVFGLILIGTGIKILFDTIKGAEHEVDVASLRTVRVLRKILPISENYEGPKLLTKINGKRAITPLMVVVIVVFVTDLVFAIDSVPAVYGITGDAYLVFATNAFALLGLRALYFVLQGALTRLVHLGYGLAIILSFIGAKLGLHWAHGIWSQVPEVPTLLSLGVIVGVLAIVTFTSLVSTRSKAASA